MIKLLIGGSPCTYWSIAQTKNRETQAAGMGWELFKNYLIAKEKFKPDFFLYENNKSTAPEIKEQIKQELDVNDGTLFTMDGTGSYIEINSALVSAQQRERFYVTNFDVQQPKDRGILLRDILEIRFDDYDGAAESMPVKEATKKGYTLIRPGQCVDLTHENSATRRGRWLSGKSHTLTTNCDMRQYLGTVDAPMCDLNGDKVVYNGKQYPVKIKDGKYITRQLTPLECERLQTMPDGYTSGVSEAQRRKALGNGWTAEIIIHLLTGALRNVPKDEEIVVLSMYDGIATGRYCLDRMGFTNVQYFACEIDKFAMQIANKNYPDIIELGDAFQVRRDEWGLPI